MGEHHVHVDDRFEEDRRRGRVRGRAFAGTPARRHIIDREHVMSVDHGALRIGTMAERGFGREAIAYGEFDRRPGLALSVHVLNGHNTSESYRLGSVARRVARWALASETDSLVTRMRRIRSHQPRERLHRKIRYWARNRGMGEDQPVKDNFLVGWTHDPSTEDPASASGALVWGTGEYNGELRCLIGGRAAPRFRGLQNLPVHYVVALREHGTITYAASSFEGARGLPAHPDMRPLAIDVRPLPSRVHAVVAQGLQGQIGFSCDTRIFGVKIADVGDLADWYTTAVLADRLVGAGGLDGEPAELGGTWRTDAGDVHRTDRGATGAVDGSSIVLAEATDPAGLVHAIIEVAPGSRAGLRWRHAAPDAWWTLELGVDGCSLDVKHDGVLTRVREEVRPFAAGVPHSVQVLDDGVAIVVTIDGEVSFGGAVVDSRHGDARGAGLVFDGAAGGSVIREFELHARAVPIPEPLTHQRIALATGDEIVLAEAFDQPRDDVDGLQSGVHRWARTMGTGRLAVSDGPGARFVASVEQPIPDRTAYTIDWDTPEFADIEIAVDPPHQHTDGARCRAGLILWQDPQNYFIVNTYLDNAYRAGSSSTFFYFRGFEDIFDAVWSNLGDLISWGEPFRMRLVSDGRRYAVIVEDEPVLYRAFSDVYPSFDRLAINRVGIVANWEWGHDTGSGIRRFVARR